MILKGKEEAMQEGSAVLSKEHEHMSINEHNKQT